MGQYLAAKKLKMLSTSGDVFFDTAFDPLNFVIAVSEKRSFLSRVDRYSLTNRPDRKLLYDQQKVVALSIIQADNAEIAFQIARKFKIGWILSSPQISLGWEIPNNNVEFNSEGYQLIRVNE